MLFCLLKTYIVRVGHTPQNTIPLRPLRNTVPIKLQPSSLPRQFKALHLWKTGLFLSFIPLPFLPPLFVLFSFCFVFVFVFVLYLKAQFSHYIFEKLVSFFLSFHLPFCLISLLPLFSFFFFSSFMFISFLSFLNSALQIWSKANNGNPD